MKKTELVSLALLSGMVSASLPAWADNASGPPDDSAMRQSSGSERPSGGGPGGGLRGRFGHNNDAQMIREMLNADQAKKLDAILEDSRAKTRSTVQQLQDLRQQNSADPAVTQKLDALEQQLRENRKQTHEQMMSLLSPEQKEQFKKKREEMKSRMGASESDGGSRHRQGQPSGSKNDGN